MTTTGVLTPWHGGAFSLPLEHKAIVAPELKLSDGGPGRISGYASTFGNKDADGDRVMPGAYKNTIDQFLRKGFITWSHDWAKQIATPSVIREDDRGLYVEAEFHSDPESQAYRTKVKERLERGKDVALSIGYKVLDSERKDGARFLKDLHLYEWAIVPVPANDQAALMDAKGAAETTLPDSAVSAEKRALGQMVLTAASTHLQVSTPTLVWCSGVPGAGFDCPQDTKGCYYPPGTIYVRADITEAAEIVEVVSHEVCHHAVARRQGRTAPVADYPHSHLGVKDQQAAADYGQAVRAEWEYALRQPADAYHARHNLAVLLARSLRRPSFERYGL